MNTAYTYLIELVPEDEKYRHLLKKSLDLLIKNIADPKDIYINVYAVDGPKKDDLIQYLKEKKVNIFDVSDGIPPYHFKRFVDYKGNYSYLTFSNHKISNYEKIIAMGYDRIIQLDTDVFFLDKVDIFDNLSEDADSFYAIKLPKRYGENHTEKAVIDALKSRTPSIVSAFSFYKNSEKDREYIYLKKLCETILNYNLDNYINDIINLGYWPNNGITVYNKNFIKKHGKIISFLNYFVSKDDEILMMLYSFAKNIKYFSLPINDNILSFNYKELDTMNIKILHTTGHDQKIEFIKEKINTL
jgi:hypothetical protein